MLRRPSTRSPRSEAQADFWNPTGNYHGQVRRRARRSGQIKPESRRVTGAEPGGPPPRSTATTHSQIKPSRIVSTLDPCIAEECRTRSPCPPRALQGRHPRSFTANHGQPKPLINGRVQRMSCSSQALDAGSLPVARSSKSRHFLRFTDRMTKRAWVCLEVALAWRFAASRAALSLTLPSLSVRRAAEVGQSSHTRGNKGSAAHSDIDSS
jgi:hypothetical protein